MKILLVDDDAGVLQALLAVLQSMPGHEVRGAASGAEALAAAAQAGGVDLLITDVVMEPMDGFTLRDHLASQWAEMRTILISGFDLSDYPEQTKHHQLLAKPIDADALRAAVIRELPAKPVPVAAPAAPVAVARAVPAAKAVPASGVRAGPAVVPKGTAVPRASAVVPSPVAAAPQQPTVRVAATVKGQSVPPSVPGVAAPASGVRPVSAVPVARPSAVVPASGVKPVAAPRSDVQTRSVTPALAPKSAVARPTVVAASVPPPSALPVPEFPSVPSGEDLSGQAFGVYQILSKLGEGRWGGTYAALQTSINRHVAMEFLDSAKAADPAAQGRFVADARAKAGVVHPSILAVYQAGEAAGRYFYAYEFVDGRNFAELKQGGERLDEPTAIKVLRVVADGLAFFGVNHKPHSTLEAANIFVGTDGNPRLANLAQQSAEGQLAVPQEIQGLGRIMLSMLPAIQSLSPGLRELLKKMVQPGAQALTSWGHLLQAIKAIEPKVAPADAAKISAQDRAAIAAVEQARKQQKRSLVYNVASLATLVLLITGFVWWFFSSNERVLDEQVEIPAGEFLFANGQTKNLPVFWIDKYEVTYGQYAKFVQFLEGHPTTEYDHRQMPRSKAQMMHKPEHWEIYFQRARAGKPVHSTPIDLNCPVMEVDFWDAYAYAKWMKRELPTEEEWEKAARGAKGATYPWGEEFDPKKVNSNADYNENDPSAKGKVDGYNFWNPVDRIKGDKSPFGVIGMAGNVREWTGTWDPVKRKPIVKGGSFMSSDVTLTQRADIDPSALSEAIGFRTVSHTPPVKK